MICLAIIFIIWEQHHYDRSTLSMLSDLCHQKINFPAYYNFKEQWLSIITEKKVEIWHSLLRNHISTHYSGDEIHDTAISLAASDTARKFHSSFVRPYTRGQSEKNMKLVAGNVFHNCKGQPHLALLTFQKKSNKFFKNKLSTTTFFILNSNKIYSRKDIVTKLEQNQSPINRSLNFTSRMTLTVLDLNADSENCFLIVFTITLFSIFNAV